MFLQIIPQGVVKDLGVSVGNCIVFENFKVLNLDNGSNRALILERAFMPTTGTVVDIQKGRITFTNIDENVYYKVVLKNRGMHLAYWIGVSAIVSVVAVVIRKGLID